MRFHSSCLFDAGQPLSVDFGMCAPTRLVFLTLVSCCWWTLACALPLVLSFWYWSVTVSGLWLVRFHSSCLFDAGQSLLVDFGVCAPTRLLFLRLVSRSRRTLTCALPLVLSFLTLVSRCWWNLTCVDLCASTRLVFFDTGQSLMVDFGVQVKVHQ